LTCETGRPRLVSSFRFVNDLTLFCPPDHWNVVVQPTVLPEAERTWEHCEPEPASLPQTGTTKRTKSAREGGWSVFRYEDESTLDRENEGRPTVLLELSGGDDRTMGAHVSHQKRRRRSRRTDKGTDLVVRVDGGGLVLPTLLVVPLIQRDRRIRDRGGKDRAGEEGDKGEVGDVHVEGSVERVVEEMMVRGKRPLRIRF
jgi:hypothetical protein